MRTAQTVRTAPLRGDALALTSSPMSMAGSDKKPFCASATPGCDVASEPTCESARGRNACAAASGVLPAAVAWPPSACGDDALAADEGARCRARATLGYMAASFRFYAHNSDGM